MQKSRSADYFERRSEEERLASERATDERAARSHRELASEYRKRAGQGLHSVDAGETDKANASQKDFLILP